MAMNRQWQNSTNGDASKITKEKPSPDPIRLRDPIPSPFGHHPSICSWWNAEIHPIGSISGCWLTVNSKKWWTERQLGWWHSQYIDRYIDITYICIYIYITRKKWKSAGMIILFPIYGKIKFMVQTTNQISIQSHTLVSIWSQSAHIGDTTWKKNMLVGWCYTPILLVKPALLDPCPTANLWLYVAAFWVQLVIV